MDDLFEKLWREDPDEVRFLYHSISDNRAGESWLTSYHRRAEERSKRKLLTRRKAGMGVSAIAARYRMLPATLSSLMEHHGLLELVQFGLDQRRRLVTDMAFRAELGHTVLSTSHIGRIEGYAKASPFPVFYEDRLGEIMWMLDYPGIKRNVTKLPGKKAKLAWLLEHHPYLPDKEIACLAGYTAFGVSKARSKARSKAVSAPPSPTSKAA